MLRYIYILLSQVPRYMIALFHMCTVYDYIGIFTCATVYGLMGFFTCAIVYGHVGILIRATIYGHLSIINKWQKNWRYMAGSPTHYEFYLTTQMANTLMILSEHPAQGGFTLSHMSKARFSSCLEVGMRWVTL